VAISNDLSPLQKQAAMQQSSGKKFPEHARYIRKKLFKSSGDWNMANVILSPYVGGSIYKTAVDDDTMSIAMYSKNVIKYINGIHHTSIQFFCDGTFSFISHLQCVILGTRIHGTYHSKFFPFAVLLTNRKTEAVYERWFQELKTHGKFQWNNQYYTGMTDMELAVSNAAQNVFPGSKWYLCWFHVMHNISEKLDELELPKKLKKIIKNEFREIHQATTLIEATEKWTKIKTDMHLCPDAKVLDELKKFIQYCEKVYLRPDRLKRWITTLDHHGQPLEATNNAIENFHGMFQKIGFQCRKSKKLELALQKFHELFQILDIDLGVAPIMPASSKPSEENALHSFFSEMKGLAQYVQNFMKTKLGGKQKKKSKSNFMDAPHTSTPKKQHQHQKAEKSDSDFDENDVTDSHDDSVMTEMDIENNHDYDIIQSNSSSSESGSSLQDDTDEIELIQHEKSKQFDFLSSNFSSSHDDLDSSEKETKIQKVDSSLPFQNVSTKASKKPFLMHGEEELDKEVIPAKVRRYPLPKKLTTRSAYQQMAFLSSQESLP
jgi:hypothetical protein